MTRLALALAFAPALATAQPKIAVAPAMVDFGNVAVGQQRSAKLTVNSAGNQNLTVTAFTLGGQDPAAFLVANVPNLPIVFPPGTGFDVDVVFRPGAARQYQATLFV